MAQTAHSAAGVLAAPNWTPCRAGSRQEFVGLCPLHAETRPSFYVNAAQESVLLPRLWPRRRPDPLCRALPRSAFRQTVAHLEQQLIAPRPLSELLEQTAAFYQLQLHRHPEAIEYLEHRGLHDPALIEELGIGYAPGGNLRRHLAALGYSLELLLDTGLINSQGRDTFCRRVIFPCRQHGQIVNLYGRSIGAAFPAPLAAALQRRLVCLGVGQPASPTVILVEGLFDLAVLWQAGFRNTTCAIGTQLTPAQLAQLCRSARPLRLHRL